jgi:predicted alpha/beta-hydrolase family hydrolase
MPNAKRIDNPTESGSMLQYLKRQGPDHSHPMARPKKPSLQMDESTGPAASSSGAPIQPPGQISFTIPNSANPSKPIPCIRSWPPSSPQDAPPALIFTHGAGGTLSAAAVVHFTTGFAASLPMLAFQGIMNLGARVKGFDAVSEDAKASGVKAVPCFGGRSMGARAAVIAATAQFDAAVGVTGVSSLILASYPLVSEKGDLRDRILLELPAEMSVLFISGDRDSMCDLGKLNEVRGKMKAKSWMAVVKGADHGMNVAGGKKATEAVGVETGRVAANWLIGEKSKVGECEIWWDGKRREVGRSEWREDAVMKAETKEEGTPEKQKELPSSNKKRKASTSIDDAEDATQRSRKQKGK